MMMISEYMGRRIMRALCWLPTVSEPQELSLKLLEILRIIPLQYQKELLLLIPEIIVDSDHKLVVNELKSLITIQSELIPPILDTLCQLKISDEETVCLMWLYHSTSSLITWIDRNSRDCAVQIENCRRRAHSLYSEICIMFC